MLKARVRFNPGGSACFGYALCGQPCCGDIICHFIQQEPLDVAPGVTIPAHWSVFVDSGYVERPTRLFSLGRHAKRSFRHAPRRPVSVVDDDGRRRWFDERGVQRIGSLRQNIEAHGGPLGIPESARLLEVWRSELRFAGFLADPKMWAGREQSHPITIACSEHGHHSVLTFEALEDARADILRRRAAQYN